MNPLKEYPHHKELLEALFEGVDNDVEYEILDAGSGRTSLYFLTTKFPNSDITALIYPGDERKMSGIERDVPTGNYVLEEADITAFEPGHRFDIVLAHLLLGEATKFGNNTFDGILDALLDIETEFLVVVDIKDDPDVDFDLFLDKVNQLGTIITTSSVDKYIGYVIECS